MCIFICICMTKIGRLNLFCKFLFSGVYSQIIRTYTFASIFCIAGASGRFKMAAASGHLRQLTKSYSKRYGETYTLFKDTIFPSLSRYKTTYTPEISPSKMPSQLSSNNTVRRRIKLPIIL